MVVRRVFVGIRSDPAPQDGVVKEIERKRESGDRSDYGKAEAQSVHAPLAPHKAFTPDAKLDDEQIVNRQAPVVDMASYYNLLDESLSGARGIVTLGSDDVRLSEKQ